DSNCNLPTHHYPHSVTRLALSKEWVVAYSGRACGAIAAPFITGACDGDHRRGIGTSGLQSASQTPEHRAIKYGPCETFWLNSIRQKRGLWKCWSGKTHGSFAKCPSACARLLRLLTERQATVGIRPLGHVWFLSWFAFVRLHRPLQVNTAALMEGQTHRAKDV